MAELGQTSDPKALVPGEPSSVDAAEHALTAQAARIDGVAAALKAVRTPSWTGSAAGAFSDAFAAEPPGWYRIADDLTAAASALRGYAGALRHAQGQAAEAIALWEQGEAATRAARAAHEAALQRAAQERAAASRDLLFGPPPGPLFTPAFVDTGAPLRAQAQHLLAQARETLRAEGRAAACALGGVFAGFQPSQAKGDPGFEGSGDWFGVDGSAHGPQSGSDGITVGADGKVYVGNAEGSYDGHAGPVHLTGEGSAFAGLSGEVGAGVSKDGVNANAGVFAGIKGEVGGDAALGPASAGASGHASAGAGADAELDVGKDGVRAEAGAHAGGKAGGDVHGDVGGIGGKAGGEVWYGPGVKAGVTAHNDGGKWTFGAEAGVSPIVGGKVDIEITVDPGKVFGTVKDAAGVVRGLVR